MSLLVFLSGLSIDFSASKLYWVSSANGTINRCNLDGSGLEVLETLKRELAKGTALAVMGEWSLSQVHQIATGDYSECERITCLKPVKCLENGAI